MDCFKELPSREKGFNRDDRIHGAIIVFNEILRCSNAAWEKKYMQLESLNVDRRIRHTDEGHSIFPRLRVPFMEKLSGHGSSSSRSTDGSDVKFFRQHSSIQESAICRALVNDNYDLICQKVLEQRNSKSPYVIQSLLTILPRLAAFNRRDFVNNHLKAVVNYLILTVKSKEKERNLAFVTLGYIAVAVEKDIAPFRTRIVDVITVALPPKETPSKKKIGVDPSVFMCITLLGHALKSAITTDIKNMILPMLSTGLSTGLTVCLHELSENVPQMRQEITSGLLKILSCVLMNKPLPQFIPGRPQGRFRVNSV